MIACRAERPGWLRRDRGQNGLCINGPAETEGTNRVIISFTLVRMLADCVGAAKYCDISIVLGITLEPMRRLHRIVASAYGIYQTQSPSLRVYVKEFMTGFVMHAFFEGKKAGKT
jgi:hypothetical protein